MDQGRLYLNFLQIAGAEVTLECNGQSALHAVRKAPTRFDAVVMDFRMPKMHGLKATQQLREIGYSGVIVAMTAFGSEELRQSWFQAGCTEYLNKPLSEQELIQAVLRHTTVAMETVEG